jgi:Glycosyl hydrolase family 99
MATVLMLMLAQMVVGGIPTSAAATTPGAGQVPVFAFFYQWFDVGSWDRAKKDYPQLGRYSSDDPRVMRQQIIWAKSAGIDAFIVSWKSSTTNNRRLKLLMTVAAEENFKLAMIYQGLDFSRQPLDVNRVAADFQYFRDELSADPVFVRMRDKPLTIFSGTWAYSHDEVATITNPVRQTLQVLSTEKNLEGYRRIADVTDGDAYYWSSVNVDTHPTYPYKLESMASAIRADGKIWIAPFAPGFDARDVNGTQVIERKDGDTLRIQYRSALQSSPDALGLISWNEFSENTHIEPSEKHGERYLDVMRELTNTRVSVDSAAQLDTADSSASHGNMNGLITNVALLVLFVVGTFGAATWMARRRRRIERMLRRTT